MATVKTLDLALQGGGAHGGYTWGVVDRLLEDPRIEIEGISGTSAGAMNGVIMADRACHAGQADRSPLDMLTGNW
ncbi:patatin-like phospholipase family protein, partial [Halomonas sp. 707D7]|uniref:patatin-like phospholipase family protein n=1 Tax=Halomonas sp. 707D7 TaxID=1681044 RepID=UPI00209E776C